MGDAVIEPSGWVLVGSIETLKPLDLKGMRGYACPRDACIPPGRTEESQRAITPDASTENLCYGT